MQKEYRVSQNDAGAMVHRLNHWWLAPLGSGVFCVSFFYKFTKTKQDEAPPSHVHGKICPKAVSFG